MFRNTVTAYNLRTRQGPETKNVFEFGHKNIYLKQLTVLKNKVQGLPRNYPRISNSEEVT